MIADERVGPSGYIPSGQLLTSDEPAEIVSPELALVDPELAERARRALPPRISYLPPRVPPVRLVFDEPPPLEETLPPVELGPLARHPTLLAAAAFVLGCASSAALLTLLPPSEAEQLGAPSASAPVTQALELPPATAPPATTAPQVTTEPQATTAPPATTAAPAATAPTTPPAAPTTQAPPARTTAPASRARTATTATSPAVPPPPVPTPVAPPQFTWPAVPGARSYRFVFYEAGLPIYEAVTRGPRHTLPLRWRFAGKRYRLSKGTYRWVVTPRLGPAGAVRDGKPIVNAAYTV